MSTSTPLYVSASPGLWLKCGWDGEWFEFQHKSQKYCSDDCKAKARAEKRQGYNKAYYWKTRKERKLRPGTISLGAHRIDDFKLEERVIRRERDRILMFLTISKRQLKSGHPPEVMGTHQYATANDYFTHSLNLLMGVPVSECLECQSTEIYKDYARAEVVCTSCGLVLHGPPARGIKYPWTEADIKVYKDQKSYNSV